MSLHILLDSYPLSMLSHPQPDPNILRWAASCRATGCEICVPEAIDYELRRELLRASRTTSVGKLDALKATLRYLPITTEAMLLAADLWAKSRQRGLATGDPKKLDIDVILAAQALTLGVPLGDLVIATSNVTTPLRLKPCGFLGLPNTVRLA